MLRRDWLRTWYLWSAAAAALLGAAGCGGVVGGADTGHTAPAVSSQSTSLATPGLPSKSTSTATASGSACTLISASDATAALGMPAGNGRAAPGVDLFNGAIGTTCQWTDSSGGAVGVGILKYPSSSIASRMFTSSKGSARWSQPVHLPGLAPSEFADTGSADGTRISEAILLDGNRELDVTINQPASAPGSSPGLSAFVALVVHAAKAWR